MEEIEDLPREARPKGLADALLTSGLSACTAEFLTLPFDTAKVRLQLNAASAQQRWVLPTTLRSIVREEGWGALFKGLEAGLHRQFLFTGLRLGLYDRIREAWPAPEGGSGPTLASRLSIAVATSAVGILAANPSDVVKVRMQASRARAPPYRSAFAAYASILRHEGLAGGLYKGFRPNLLRNIIVSSMELVGYDTAKQELLRRGHADGFGVHLSAGAFAGLLATVVGSPMDIVATRLMAQKPREGIAPQGMGSTILAMARQEGLLSFWKGFVPNFARIGSFNIVLWLSYEQFQRHIRVSSLL